MPSVEQSFLDFVTDVVNGDIDAVSGRLTMNPVLATAACETGATRDDPTTWFFPDIARHFYAGDTALHAAAATFRRPVAELLVARGADCRARNRRGAQPLHYAADANHWNPEGQAEMVAYLVSIGADPDAPADHGVTPLHRAVRTRSSSAVRALLDGGADPRRRNGAGSTPLHLAVQGTGRPGSGSARARREQEAIIRLLLERGASPGDADASGRRVDQSARSAWLRDLLRTAR